MKAIKALACAFVIGVSVASCSSGEAPNTDAATVDSAASQLGGHDMGGMQGGAMSGMRMDPAMMHRHAAEMDSVVLEMRRHMQEMRRLSPTQWHARMGEHAPRVAHMVGMIERQTREMDMGMNMGDEQMGQMMGMSGEEHRRMMDDVQALRTEVGELQTGSQADLAARMPAHLDRIDRVLRMMETSAAHMSKA